MILGEVSAETYKGIREFPKNMSRQTIVEAIHIRVDLMADPSNGTGIPVRLDKACTTAAALPLQRSDPYHQMCKASAPNTMRKHHNI